MDENRNPYDEENPDLMYWPGHVPPGGDPDKKAPVYTWVKEINEELKKIGPVFRELDFDTAVSVKYYPGSSFKPIRYIQDVHPLNSPYQLTHYEVSTFTRRGLQNYFMIVNRHTLPTDKIKYYIKIFLRYGARKIWKISSKTDSTIVWEGNGQYAEFEYTVEPGKGVLFKVEGESSGNISTQNPEATAYNNARKVVVEKNGITHICYMDGTEDSPEVWYAVSPDNGETWYKEKIADGYSPAIALTAGGHPVVAWSTIEGGHTSLYFKDLFTGVKAKITEKSGQRRPKISLAIGMDASLGEEVGMVVFEFNGQIWISKPFPLDGSMAPKPASPLDISTSCASPSITFDAFDRPVVVYERNGNIILKYLQHPGTRGEEWREMHIGYGKNPSIDTKGQMIGIVWEDGDIVMRTGIATDNGFELGEERRVSVTGVGDEEPEVKDINFVVWDELNEEEVYLSCNTQDGLSEPSNISQSLERSRYAHIDNGFAGRSIVIWTEGDDAPYEVKSVDLINPYGDVVVVRPNGGERFLSGTYEKIRWQISDAEVQNSMLFWCDDYGDNPTWKPIATVPTPGAGVYEYNWKVPVAGKRGNLLPLTCHTCRVKVVTDNGKGDISDENFTICNNWIHHRLGSLLQGIIPSGSERDISWKCYGEDIQGINIYLSRDAGATFNSLEQGLSPGELVAQDTFYSEDSTDTLVMCMYQGSYTWTVSEAPSSGCRIKIEAYESGERRVEDITSLFVIPLPGGFEYSTSVDQNVIGEYNNKIYLTYTGKNDTTDVVYYAESCDGYEFEDVDTVGEGWLPSTDEGVVCYLSGDRDKIYYTYRTDTGFALPYIIDGGENKSFSTIGIDVKDDTVYLLYGCNEMVGWRGNAYNRTMQLRSFYKYNPSLFFMDTVLINIGITIPFQFTGTPWVRKNDNTLYYAFSVNDTCYYCEKDSSGVYMEIFEGAYPNIKVSEGNLILSYVKGDTVYRRIKYREREDWIREDFFTVSEEIENFGVTEGMVYDVSLIDTNVVRYEYDMLSSGFYLSEVEEGKWSHPYIFKRDRFYKVFTGVLLEDTTWYVDLLRRQYIGMVPSYYMEAESLKSPFTVYRDGYIDYSDFLVEYGEDSLVYSFPVFSVDKSYGIVIRLYHEGAGERVVEIEINGERDTVITGPGVMFWFNKELDNVSFVDLRIRRLSADRGIGVMKIVLFEKDP